MGQRFQGEINLSVFIVALTERVRKLAKQKRKQPKIPRIIEVSGSYRCQITSGGKRISITEKTYEECMSKAMDVLSKRIVNKEYTGKSNRKNITLYQATGNYIANRSNVLSPSTILGYKKMQEYRFRSAADMKISKIDNWQTIINAESKLCSPKTLKNAWGLVKSVLRENDIPIPNVRLPQVVEAEHEFFEPDQIKDFLSVIENDRYEIVYLLGLHGLRSSEIYGLDLKNGIKNGVIKVRGAKVSGVDGYVQKATNKNTSSRRDVPIMIPRLEALMKKDTQDIEAMRPEHPFVARRHMKTLCIKNNLPDVGLHGLRHSFASLCYHLGMSEMETMRLGGWSDAKVMRKIYTHLSQKDMQLAESKLKNFFAE